MQASLTTENKNNNVMWRIGFIGGHFKFLYKADTQTVEVWKCLKSGTEEQIGIIKADHPNIGEAELSLMGNAFIQGMACQTERTPEEPEREAAQSAEDTGTIERTIKSVLSSEINGIVSLLCLSVVEAVSEALEANALNFYIMPISKSLNKSEAKRR